MMNYSKMSDFEINKMVGKATKQAIGIESCFGVVIRNANGKEFNPCNNPADAWPIIVENRISIMFDGTDPQYEGEYHEWVDSISPDQKNGIQHQSNPLRAAMIVFLMMQDNK